MWIKKLKYNDIISTYESRVDNLKCKLDRADERDILTKNQMDKLKTLLTRQQVLSMYSYWELKSMAERDYGIFLQNGEDKADVIRNIVSVEMELKALTKS